ncbi:MAG: DUF429 domain-containing protein [Euryarchaeota archaeon]|nr:DUF429 domain-containing protein [Euryarchaeota archaeon]
MSSSESVFIGIDLGTSILRKSTGIACFVEKKGKPWMESPPMHIKSDDELIHTSIIQMSSENFGSRIIGIDAPLSRPDHGTMRECEIRLRKHGIACYPSGAEWVSKWVSKGIELKEWAEKELNAKVIEVYPYAARRALDIGAEVKKKTKQGRSVIQDGLLGFIGGLDEFTKDKLLSDDELDAILSAYVAYCEGKGAAVKMDGEDGVIYLPVKRRDYTIFKYI